MIPMNVLQWLRKRKQKVVAAILPLLATVWFGASAWACVGMALGEIDGAAPGAAEKNVHDRSASRDHGAHGDHATHASGNPASEPVHSHSAPAHSHGSCPHCPVSSDDAAPLAATNHVVCSVLDEVSDGTAKSSALKSDLLQTPPLPHVYVAPLDVQRPSFPRRSVAHPSVALNLRHCCFLI